MCIEGEVNFKVQNILAKKYLVQGIVLSYNKLEIFIGSSHVVLFQYLRIKEGKLTISA